VLEALARANAIGGGNLHKSPQPYGTIPEDGPLDAESNGNTRGLELTSVGGNGGSSGGGGIGGGGGGGGSDSGGTSEEAAWVVGNERIDMPQLCLLFLGEKGKLWYAVSIVFYVYASLWAYAVLVATTLSVALPLADPFDPLASAAAMNLFSYRLYLVSFGVVTAFIATKVEKGINASIPRHFERPRQDRQSLPTPIHQQTNNRNNSNI
jgi:hypothetical protein